MRKLQILALLLAALAGSVSAQTPAGAYSSPASGSGGGSVTQVTSLPATCTPGQSFQLPSSQIVFCGATANTFVADGVQAINMMAYGVKADLRTCIGTQGTLTSGQPTFTCTGGNFCDGSIVACPTGQTADVGKRINGTSGCCNLSPGGAPVNNQVIPNNTTILSVQSATSLTMSANATATLSGASTLFVWWATDDDAATTLADTAYQNFPVCSVLLWPATPFLVKNPHFNTPNQKCVYIAGGGIGGLREAAGTYLGLGPSGSVMYLDSTFPNSVPCTFGPTSNGCFFGYAGVHASHLGISGGWNLVPNGGGHSYWLINPDTNAFFEDDLFVGFSGGDGTSQGFHVPAFSNLNSVFVQALGNTCMVYNGTNTVFNQGYYGNCYGTSARFDGSAGVSPVTTYGISFGTARNTVNEVIITGGPWYSYGDYFYGLGNTCISNQGVAGTIAHIDGGTIGGNGSCTTAVGLGTNTGFTIFNTTVNSTTTAVSAGAGSSFTDSGTNIFGGAGTFTINATAKYNTSPTSTYANQTGLVPACTFSTGGGTTPSCALQAGSTNEKGVMIASTGTGAPGSQGTVTLTFAGTFAGPTGNAPPCIYTLDNSGTAWGAEAIVFANTQSTTAPTLAWTNINAVALTPLTVSSPYRIAYTCTPR